jgi:hypothetical protein
LHIFPSVRSANCAKTWHRKEIWPARSRPLELAHASKTQTPQRKIGIEEPSDVVCLWLDRQDKQNLRICGMLEGRHDEGLFA